MKRSALKRDARGRFVKRRAAGKRARRTNPGLTLKVAFPDGPPIALFRSVGRAKQYARALAQHTGKRVRLFNPKGRAHKRHAGAKRQLVLNPNKNRPSSSGKYHVAARVRGRLAYMGWHDGKLETRREDSLGFSTKSIARSEARRMAKLWPQYPWFVETP